MADRQTKIRKCYFPDYWDTFACKGGDCRTTCCGGWNIEISWAEYYRLAELKCSEELRRRIDEAILLSDEPTEDKFITPDKRGKCPMFDDDGLCMLQKECGADAITAICRQFPRGCKTGSCGTVLSLANSCEAVVELLLSRRAPIRILSDERAPLELNLSATDILPPEYTEKCFAIMQDRSMPLSRRLETLGSYLEDPENASDCSANGAGHAAPSAAALQALMRLSRNCLHSGRLLIDRAEKLFARYQAEGGQEAFLNDLAKFRADCPDHEIMLENLLVNHMIHGYFTGATYYGGGALFSGLVCVYGAVLVFTALQWEHEPGLTQLADMLSALFRYIDHSAYYLIGPDTLGVKQADLDNVLTGIARL